MLQEKIRTENMSKKIDFLKMQIENMKETVIENENVTIWERDKKDISGRLDIKSC